MARLKDKYEQEIAPKLVEQFGYTSKMQIPKLTKIVVNMGLGEAIQNIKILENAVEELTALTGQKPVVRKAKRSVASFKLREGMPIGACVTMRRQRMYEFFDRLLGVALPRVRDFRGLTTNGFDGRGNFSMGIQEQIIFPEIVYDKIDKIRGMNITFVTTAKNDEEGAALLRHFGMPFTEGRL